jgi:hypothetical protein
MFHKKYICLIYSSPSNNKPFCLTASKTITGLFFWISEAYFNAKPFCLTASKTISGLFWSSEAYSRTGIYKPGILFYMILKVIIHNNFI